MPYRTLARMKPETRDAIQVEAERVKTAFGATRRHVAALAPSDA
jgi:hypothetical protein